MSSNEISIGRRKRDYANYLCMLQVHKDIKSGLPDSEIKERKAKTLQKVLNDKNLRIPKEFSVTRLINGKLPEPK